MGKCTRPILALSLVSLVALASTSGCGGGPGKMTPASTYVYAAQEQRSGQGWAGSIAQLMVGADGSLTSLQPSAVATNEVPTSLAIHPSGKFLLESASSGVTEYVIGNDGTLTAAWTTPVATGIPAIFTPDGHFVIAPGLGPGGLPSNTITVYSFASDGTMTLVAVSGTVNDLGPIAIDSSSQFVYGGSSTDSRIYEFSLSAGGALTPIGSVSASFGPWWLPVSAQGFLYSPNNGTGGEATVFQINPSDGTLTPGNTFVVCPLAAGGFPVTFSPSGKNAYVSCGGTLSQFSVDAATGTFISNGPDLPNVGTLTMDPSGASAFAFTNSDSVSQFTVNSDGTLKLSGTLTLGTSMVGETIASAQK